MIDASPAEMPALLLQRGLDFAVLPRGAGVVGRRLAVERFHREPLVIVCAPDHPLSKTETPSLKELARERFIFNSRDSDRLALVEERLRAVGTVQLRIVLQMNLEAAKRLVRAGLGISVMLRCTVSEELGRGELGTIQVTGIDLYQDLVLLYHHEQRFSPAASQLMQLIRESGSGHAVHPLEEPEPTQELHTIA